MISWPWKLEMPMDFTRPFVCNFSIAVQVSWMVAVPGITFSPS